MSINKIAFRYRKYQNCHVSFTTRLTTSCCSRSFCDECKCHRQFQFTSVSRLSCKIQRHRRVQAVKYYKFNQCSASNDYLDGGWVLTLSTLSIEAMTSYKIWKTCWSKKFTWIFLWENFQYSENLLDARTRRKFNFFSCWVKCRMCKTARRVTEFNLKKNFFLCISEILKWTSHLTTANCSQFLEIPSTFFVAFLYLSRSAWRFYNGKWQ